MLCSPFILARPIAGPDFFGRTAELARINTNLVSGRGVNIFSQSRMGNSSILLEVSRQCTASDNNWKSFLPVVVDCFPHQGFSEALAKELRNEGSPNSKSALRTQAARLATDT